MSLSLLCVQLFACFAPGLRIRVAIDDVAVLHEGLAATPQPLQGQTLLEAGIRRLVARREVPEQRIPSLDGLRVLLLAVQTFADPVLRIVGKLGAGIGPQVILETADREVVVAPGVVGVGLAVELTRRGDGAAARGARGRRRASRRRGRLTDAGLRSRRGD